MELVFRKLPPAESLEPQPGEIFIVPAAREDRHRRDLAKYVLERGAEGLLRGAGTPARMVLDADPKLDDMLAAFLAQFQLQGRNLPAGCQAFAEYSAQLREGHRPTSMPLEDSLEGIYLAIRGNVEKSLTDPESARHFIGDWSRMAEVIFKAAEQGNDPFTTSVFPARTPVGVFRTNPLRSINRGLTSGPTGVGFLREQAFLAKDLDVYRQDYARGEKWTVRIPGGPPSGQALVLRKPKSLLFKYWTRSPCPPPLDGPYLLLAVTLADSQWVFSADPARKLSLKPLADLLQEAERKKTAAVAERDPWYDGKSFQHTLVSAPRGGTKLSEKTVLGIAKKWCRARPVDWGRRLLRKAALAACLAGVLGLAFFFGKPLLDRKSDAVQDRITNTLTDYHDLFVLSVGVSDYKNLRGGSLPNAAKDAEDLAQAFKKLRGAPWSKVSARVLKNEDATRREILQTGLSSWLLEQQTPTAHSLVIVTFSGHGFIESRTSRYHFAPQDYDPADQSTGIYFSDLQRYLDQLKCTVVLVFDTCHSGAVNEMDDADPNSPQNLLKTIQKFVTESGSKKGLVVMAACGSYQKANETDRWGHGALTLALLEGIEGTYLYRAQDLYQTPFPKANPTGVITLQELDRYVSDRVEVLSSEISAPKYRRQAARTFATGNIALDEIPIVVHKKE